MAKEIKINKYRVLDKNRGGFTVEAKNAINALKKLGYYNIEKTEMGNILIIGLSGDKRNYIFTATYRNKEDDK